MAASLKQQDRQTESLSDKVAQLELQLEKLVLGDDEEDEEEEEDAEASSQTNQQQQ